MRDNAEYFHYDLLPATLLFRRVVFFDGATVRLQTTAVTYNNGFSDRDYMRVTTFRGEVSPNTFLPTSDQSIGDTPLDVGGVTVYTGQHFASGEYNGQEKMTFYPVKAIASENKG